MGYNLTLPLSFHESIEKLSRMHGIQIDEEYTRAIALYLYLNDNDKKGPVKNLRVERENGELEEISDFIDLRRSNSL